MDSFIADGIYIDSPAPRVWDGLLSPADLAQWLGALESRVEARVRGLYAVRLPGDAALRGTIRLLEPPTELRLGDLFLRYGARERGPFALSFRLEPRREGVWLLARLDDLDRAGPDWQQFAHEERARLVKRTLALKRHIDQI
jgi:uncharacterized protein YndB with AHSA1/START domain